MSNTEVAINTAADNAVLSAVGNGLLKFHSAGWIGVLFNLTTLSTCIYMRSQSEIRKTRPLLAAPSGRVEAALRDIRTSLAVSGIVQLSVAATIAARNGRIDRRVLQDMAVPLLFGTGSAIASQSVFRTLYRGVADSVTTTAKNIQNPARKFAAYILGQPDLYWNVGLMFAGDSKIITGILAAGLVLQLVQGAWKMRVPSNAPQGIFGRFMDMTNAPILIQAGGCAASAVVHAHAGHGFDAGAMGLYSLGFLGYIVENKWNGAVEAYHAVRPAVKKITGSTSALVA